ncbi:hypothetical protein [Massilia timonae]|uniref:hypothetical protein n=1 Tax=Massilia timonae TaxID=47229 RepID=UPI002352C202|nr:hypothetical protein [Massilia timonae]
MPNTIQTSASAEATRCSALDWPARARTDERRTEGTMLASQFMLCGADSGVESFLKAMREVIFAL